MAHSRRLQSSASADEGQAWVAEILAKHEAGTFFAVDNYYTFHATKNGQ